MINILLLLIVVITFISLNLVIFIKFKENSKNKKILLFISKLEKYSACLIIIILSYLFIDMAIFRFLGHGYPSNQDHEKIQRMPTPYDFFWQLDSTAARLIRSVSFTVAFFGLYNLRTYKMSF